MIVPPTTDQAHDFARMRLAGATLAPIRRPLSNQAHLLNSSSNCPGTTGCDRSTSRSPLLPWQILVYNREQRRGIPRIAMGLRVQIAGVPWKTWEFGCPITFGSRARANATSTCSRASDTIARDILVPPARDDFPLLNADMHSGLRRPWPLPHVLPTGCTHRVPHRTSCVVPHAHRPTVPLSYDP